MKTFWRSKLCIAEAFWLAVELVFYKSDVGNIAVGQKTLEIDASNIVVEVSEMCGIRWLRWEWD